MSTPTCSAYTYISGMALERFVIVLLPFVVSGVDCASTRMVTMAGAESTVPSLTLKVNESVPEKPALGV